MNFLEQWAKILKVQCTRAELPFAIAAELVNQAKNFQSASAVLFGLSFRTHAEYIREVEAYWRANWSPDAIATKEWCEQFQQHYVNDVKAYPEDA